MANKLPPGATQGINAGKTLAGHIQGAGGGPGLDGHSAMNISAVAPARTPMGPKAGKRSTSPADCPPID